MPKEWNNIIYPQQMNKERVPPTLTYLGIKLLNFTILKLPAMVSCLKSLSLFTLI